MSKNKRGISRRKFLQESVRATLGSAIAINFPTIIPASVLGKNAPSNLINVASIGCGRISTIHDMTEIARYSGARIIAVCDLDRNRADTGPAAVRANYKKAAKQNGGLSGDWEIKVYYDYKELLQNKDIDAVHISLPD